MNKREFPYQLTDFIEKINAKYEGDPEGDYVLAEHINHVQDAISRIEKTIGINSENSLSIEERISKINNLSLMKVDSVGYFSSLDSKNTSYLKSILSKYSLIILDKYDNNTKEIASENKTYGRIDTEGKNLKEIQNNIGEWKEKNVNGIYIDNLSRRTREEEIDIYNSVIQENLKVILSGDIEKLLNNQVSEYNKNQIKFPFKRETIILLKDFGYNDNLRNQKYASHTYIMNNLYPLIKEIRSKELGVMSFSNTPNKKSYLFVQGLALLLGLDYMYTGQMSGSLINRLPQEYESNNISADWKTKEPLIFNENQVLHRSILNGSIQIDRDNNVSFPGLSTSSDVIRWVEDSMDGAAAKIGSIPPNRLRTYDVKKIVDLINNATEDVRINPNKINSDESSGLLPVSFDASHMILNVIEAINKKNNINSQEKGKIESSAILELSTDKLTGQIKSEQITKNVVGAINSSSTDFNVTPTNYISIPYAKIDSIRGTGVADYSVIQAEEASFVNASVSNIFSAKNLNVDNKLSAKNAEIDTILANQITTSSLTGLLTLEVDELRAGNIEGLVLSAVTANIHTGNFDSIVTKSLESSSIVTEIIKATTSYGDLASYDKARIDSMIAASISAEYGFFEQLDAGIINTDKLEIESQDGVLSIKGSTIKIYDAPGKKDVSDIRILIGHLEEATGNPDDYGFMALDATGKNKIFDHTGVYEGGIHKDSINAEAIKDGSITEDKVEDGSITEGKIRHNSIVVNHLRGKIITGEWIDAGAITADKIFGKTITADKLASDSIETRHLVANVIEGNHIKGNVIEGKHIISRSISTEHLKVGFEANLMKDGMDSFEQYRVGETTLNELNKDTIKTFVQKEEAFEGKQALEAFSFDNNKYMHIGQKILIEEYVESNKEFAFSAFVKTPKGSKNTNIRLGFMLFANEKENIYITGDVINTSEQYRRHSFILKDLNNYTHIIPVILFEKSNDSILIDALQVEKIPSDGEISPWRTTATTTINGDNITTGRVDSQYIQIGDNTIFGDDSIIKLSNKGILVQAGMNKTVNIGSKGIEVVGGAFTLTGGQGTESINIDGDKGVIVENNLSRIEMSSKNGLNVFNLKENKVVLSINPDGNLRFSGTAEFLSSDDKTTSIDFYEQQKEIESQRKEALEQAKELKTQQETIDTQEKLLKEQNDELKKEKEKIIEQRKEINKESILRKFDAQGLKYTLSLEMKVGYSGFNERSLSHVYFHGYTMNEKYQFVKADVPGELHSPYENTYFPIPNKPLYLGAVPKGIGGYIIWDNTKKEMDFIYMDSKVDKNQNITKEWVRTKKYPDFDFNESVFVIGELVT